MSTDLATLSVADTTTLAQTFVKSGFFTDAKDASQAVVKILAGRELGFGPMASMTGVYIVKGKVALSANLLAASIKRSGRYNYRVTELSDERCAITFLEHGEPCGESVFTMADAKSASLTGNETWRKFPRNMLFARALSNGARWHCADVFGGPLYTPDELGAAVDGETGEVIEAPLVTHVNGETPEDVIERTKGVLETMIAPVVATPGSPEASNAALGVRRLSELAIESGDVEALADIRARVVALPKGPHRTNAERWLALATALLDPDSLDTPTKRNTVRRMLEAMPDDVPSRDAGLAILDGLDDAESGAA